MTDEQFFEMVQRANRASEKEAFIEGLVSELIGEKVKRSESFFLKHFAELCFFLGHLTNLSRLETSPTFKVGSRYDSEDDTYYVFLTVSTDGAGCAIIPLLKDLSLPVELLLREEYLEYLKEKLGAVLGLRVEVGSSIVCEYDDETHEVLEVFPFGARVSYNGKPTLIGWCEIVGEI